MSTLHVAAASRPDEGRVMRCSFFLCIAAAWPAPTLSGRRASFDQGFAGAGAAVDGAGADFWKSKFTLGAVRAPSSVLK